MKTLLDNVGDLQMAQQKIALTTITGLIFVPIQDIVRLEAKGKHTIVYLSSGKPIEAIRTMKDYEEILPETIFFRIHTAHIINFSRIKAYQKGRGGAVVMEDDSIIEVASRRREEFLSKLLK
jgi:two-component system LytT family response regulator